MFFGPLTVRAATKVQERLIFEVDADLELPHGMQCAKN